MVRPLSAQIALALATLTSAVGCLHPAELSGDIARANGDRAKALRDYDQALGEDDDEVYAYEKARIEAKRKEVMSDELRHELDAPRKGTPRSIVAGLHALWSRARDERATPEAMREIQSAIDAEALKGLPEIEAAAQAKRYGAAVPLVAFYAGVVSADHPLRDRVKALASEAIAFHRGLASAAKGAGGRLLHARIAQAFGGLADAEAEAAVRKAVGVAWTVDVKQSGCPFIESGLARAFAAKVGAPGTIVLRLACETSKHEFDEQERYSYTTTESYETVEQQERLVELGRPSSYHVECPTNDMQANGQMRACSGVESRTPSYLTTETVDVTVTRQRFVDRTETRDTHHIEYTTKVTGSIEASARAAGPDENIVFTMPASLSATVSASSFEKPYVKRIPSDFGSYSAEMAALDKAKALVSALVSKMQEGRASPYVKEAEAAASADDRAAAEESFMIAREILGHPEARFSSLLTDAYGFSPSDGERAVAGASLAFVPLLPDATTPDKPIIEETAHVDLEFDFLFTRLVSPDAAPQPGREALGGTFQIGGTLVTHFVRDSLWGFGYYDFAWLGFYLGGRTIGFADATGDEESRVAGAIELGYRPYLGYRASQWGVFVGGRGHLIAQALGGLHQSGALLALAGTVEWRVGGPSVLTLSGWATPASSGNRTFGGELTLPFGRSGAGLKLVLEKRSLSTRLPKKATDNVDYDEIGSRDAVTMSVGLSASTD